MSRQTGNHETIEIEDFEETEVLDRELDGVVCDDDLDDEFELDDEPDFDDSEEQFFDHDVYDDPWYYEWEY